MKETQKIIKKDTFIQEEPEYYQQLNQRTVSKKNMIQRLNDRIDGR